MKKHDSPIYRTILDLPLIKGASSARLTEIAGKYKLHFLKFQPGQTIVTAGTPCDELKFVLTGVVRLTITDPDGLLTVSQTLTAPQVIAPDHLFGRLTQYPATVQAVETTGIMEISKEEYRRMLSSDTVFLFNYLNSVCTTSQRGPRWLTALTSGSPIQRIAYWISSLTQQGSTNIEIRAEKTDLHTVFGIPAPAWRSATNHLSSAGLIKDVTPHSFHVPSRAPLAALLN
ncbi:MAG: Crp/Fnr family transcriptional regulator [Muribaculaceae bacterium]|nr:Crp/Fnr family transcriptional regulator [Muribaculaceae bacterium]